MKIAIVASKYCAKGDTWGGYTHDLTNIYKLYNEFLLDEKFNYNPAALPIGWRQYYIII